MGSARPIHTKTTDVIHATDGMARGHSSQNGAAIAIGVISSRRRVSTSGGSDEIDQDATCVRLGSNAKGHASVDGGQINAELTRRDACAPNVMPLWPAPVAPNAMPPVPARAAPNAMPLVPAPAVPSANAPSRATTVGDGAFITMIHRSRGDDAVAVIARQHGRPVRPGADDACSYADRDADDEA